MCQGLATSCGVEKLHEVWARLFRLHSGSGGGLATCAFIIPAVVVNMLQQRPS